MKCLIFTLAIISFLSCTKDSNNGVKDEPIVCTDVRTCITKCVQSSIDSALSKPKGSLFYTVDLYKYNNDSVYFYVTGCCDRYNPVKDKNCNYLFAPSGGIGGFGDGTHTNFFTQATLLGRVWVDPRP
jgi:hypothetical protein